MREIFVEKCAANPFFTGDLRYGDACYVGSELGQDYTKSSLPKISEQLLEKFNLGVSCNISN